MAVRRTLDSLIEEFASLRGVSGDNAIRIALTDAIAHEEQPEREANVDEATAGAIREVVLKQVMIARIEAAIETRSRIFEEMVSPIVLGLAYLAFSLFFARSFIRAMVFLFFLLGSGLLSHYYFRTLEKRKQEETLSKENLKVEVLALGGRLPKSLESLCDGTADELSWLLSLEEHEEQQ